MAQDVPADFMPEHVRDDPGHRLPEAVAALNKGNRRAAIAAGATFIPPAVTHADAVKLLNIESIRKNIDSRPEFKKTIEEMVELSKEAPAAAGRVFKELGVDPHVPSSGELSFSPD